MALACFAAVHTPGAGRAAAASVPGVLFASLADLVAPLRCGGCLTPVPPGPVLLCPPCLAAAHAARLPGLGWTRLRPGLLAVSAFAYTGPVAAALRRAKTPGGHGLAPGLALLLWGALRLDPAALPAVRTWVPSVPRTARTRARELPRVLAGPGAVALLARRGNPPDQAGLDPARRRVAPYGTFVARGPVPPVVVLVDDVRTTGATALAAAAALERAGARRVLLATLALGGQDARSPLSLARSPGAAGTAR